MSERTDSEFIREVRDLTLGTHWAQDRLKDWCYVQVKKDEEPAEDGFERDPEMDLHAEPDRIYYKKARYCLVGMILKVGDLDIREPYLADVRERWDEESNQYVEYVAEPELEVPGQVERIFRIVHDCLPDNHKANMDVIRDESCSPERQIVADIESWNDQHDRTREEVVDLLTAAEQKAIA